MRTPDELTRPIPPELLDCLPSPGWALIRPLQRTGTSGGILLPTPQGDAEIMSGLRVGRVVAMGPPRQLEFGGLETVRCEPGNTVLYDASKGLFEVHLEGSEHHLLRHLGIVAQCKAADDLYKIPVRHVVELATQDIEVVSELPRPVRANGR